MVGDDVVRGLWLTIGCLAALQMILFLVSRQPRSLRGTGLAGFAAISLAMRGGLDLCGLPPDRIADPIGLTVTCLLAWAGLVGRRCWLVRTTLGEWNRRLEQASRGLRLDLSGSLPGLRLPGDSATIRLRTIGLSERLLIVCFPRGPLPIKLTLLVFWLRKSYPSAGPYLRFDLRRHPSGDR